MFISLSLFFHFSFCLSVYIYLSIYIPSFILLALSSLSLSLSLTYHMSLTSLLPFSPFLSFAYSFVLTLSLSLFSFQIPLYISLLSSYLSSLFRFRTLPLSFYLISFYSSLITSPNFTSPSVRSFMLSQKSAAFDLYQIILPKYAEYLFFTFMPDIVKCVK